MSVDWSEQRCFEDVAEGDELPAVSFPLPVYRLVMSAAASRDFNSIHHNPEFARATGAPDIYANNTLLQGMWERTVREYIGLAGTLRSLKGFRIKSFNIAGETVTVRGRVERAWLDGDVGRVQLSVWSENATGVTVGPGTVEVTLPRRG